MKNRYTLFILIVSISVATLIHFPELVSLFDVFESQTLFPGMRPADVVSEVFFTFISLVILFEVNTLLFHFNQPAVKITWQKMILSLILTWILSSLLGKCFVFFHHTFDIPAIDAMVHHYLHPLRDFIITCTVSGSCYISYLIRRQQEVVIENQQLQAENIFITGRVIGVLCFSPVLRLSISITNPCFLNSIFMPSLSAISILSKVKPSKKLLKASLKR